MKKLFYNATVYTGNDFQEAFIVEDNRFIFVGKEKDALRLINENDEKIDLNGLFVCAGFNDSHMHLLSLGRSLSVARLNQHTSSKKEMYDYLKGYVSKSDEEWIIGMGWNQNSFSDDRDMPVKKELDAICDDLRDIKKDNQDMRKEMQGLANRILILEQRLQVSNIEYTGVHGETK